MQSRFYQVVVWRVSGRIREVSLTFGKFSFSDHLVASLRKDVFLIFSVGFQESTIFLHGLLLSILLYLSKVRGEGCVSFPSDLKWFNICVY